MMTIAMTIAMTKAVTIAMTIAITIAMKLLMMMIIAMKIVMKIVMNLPLIMIIMHANAKKEEEIVDWIVENTFQNVWHTQKNAGETIQTVAMKSENIQMSYLVYVTDAKDTLK